MLGNMEKTSESSTRGADNGSGGGGDLVSSSGTTKSKSTNKSDDDDTANAKTDLWKRVLRRGENRSGSSWRKRNSGTWFSTTRLNKKDMTIPRFRWKRGEGDLHLGDATLNAKPKSIPQPLPEQNQQYTDVGKGKVKVIQRQLPDTPTLPSAAAPDIPTTTLNLPATTIVPQLITNSLGNTEQTILTSATPPPSPVIVEDLATVTLSESTTTSSTTSETSATIVPPPGTGTTQPPPVTTVPTPTFTGTNSTGVETSWSLSITTTSSGTVILSGVPSLIPIPAITSGPSAPSQSSSITISSLSSQTSLHIGFRNSTTISTSTSTTSHTSTISSSSTLLSATTWYPGSGGAGYPPPALSTPTSTSTSDAGPTIPPTSQLVGGIVGGLAASALFLLLILFALRRHKRRLREQALDDAGYGGPLPGRTSGSALSSIGVAVGAVIGRLVGRGDAEEAAAEVTTEERGFVRVGGRRLEPVLGGPRPRGYEGGSYGPGQAGVYGAGYGATGYGGQSYNEKSGSGGSGMGLANAANAANAGHQTKGNKELDIGPKALEAGSAYYNNPGEPGKPRSQMSPPGSPGSPGSQPPISPTTAARQKEMFYSSTPIPAGPSNLLPPPTVRVDDTDSASDFSRADSRAESSTGGDKVLEAGAMGSPGSQGGMIATAAIGGKKRDALGRSMPSHDGSRASKFTEDIV